MKTHFRGKSKSWMNGSMVCYKCNKVNHLKRDCRSPMSSNVTNQNEDIYEKLRNQMEKTWRKKEQENSSEATTLTITQSNGSGDHTSSN